MVLQRDRVQRTFGYIRASRAGETPAKNSQRITTQEVIVRRRPRARQRRAEVTAGPGTQALRPAHSSRRTRS